MKVCVLEFDFTKREVEIVHMLLLGNSSLEIANTLSISRHTVDTHRRKILKKAQVKNTMELVTYFFNKPENTQH